jgi:hypothetical protein
MTDRISFLERRIAELQSERDRLETEIDKLIELGDDVYPDDSVLLFRKHYAPPRMNRQGRPIHSNYTYVALKAGGFWWLTGSAGAQRKTWDELVRFLTNNVTELWEAREWVKIQ